MPLIAPQHSPAAPIPIHEGYAPVCAWPANAGVQWGDGRSFTCSTGQVTGSPAFFEAFLRNESGVWFRGEAPTEPEDRGIEKAERAAFAKFEKYLGCGDDHDWVRKHDEYSTVARCSCCGATGTHAVAAKERTVSSDGPLTPSDLQHLMLGLLHEDRRGKRDHGDQLNRYFERVYAAIEIRAERQGFPLPDPTMDQEAYDAICERRVARFWVDNRSACEDIWNSMTPEEQKASYPPYWSALDICCLDDVAKRQGHLPDLEEPSAPGMGR